MLSEIDKENEIKNRCHREAFVEFLEKVKNPNEKEFECKRLLLVGDIFDLWLRDDSGIMYESYNIIKLLEEIHANGIEVHILLGNHDYYLRTLKNVSAANGEKYRYPFFNSLRAPFHESALVFVDNEKPKDQKLQYWFIHGDEFDSKQLVELFDYLSTSSHDETGAMYNLSFRSLVQLIEQLVIVGKEGLQQPGVEKKQQDKIHNRVNRFAIDPLHGFFFSNLKKAKQKLNLGKGVKRILIYGHTHKAKIYPYNEDTMTLLANPGAWIHPALENEKKRDEEKEPTCTFLKIEKSNNSEPPNVTLYKCENPDATQDYKWGEIKEDLS
ncbi:MAG: metallophosphoesterase [Candidatus Hodarchaeota archaeon]